MMKTNLIIYAVVLLLCVGLKTQDKQPNPRKAAYSESRSISFVVGEREFNIEFTDEDLTETPLWDNEKQPPPLSIVKAIEIGRSCLGRYVQSSQEWMFEKLHYDKIGNNKWVCILAFRSPLNSIGETDVFTIVIKMDGKIIEPQVGLKRK